MVDVVTMGESLALFVQSIPGVARSSTPFAFRIGGAESNVAIGLARLGVDVAWVGRLGQDPFGDEVVRVLQGEGVHVHAIRDGTRPTGLMVKDRRTARHQRVAYYRNGSAASALEPDDLVPVAPPARVLHLTGITLAISASSRAAAAAAAEAAVPNGTRVSFDVNYRSALWTRAAARQRVLALLPHVDLLFANLDEAALLLDNEEAEDAIAIARRLQMLGPSEVVVKLGEYGAAAVAGRAEVALPAIPVDAVDTVGAGDAFVAGYLAAGLDGIDLHKRLTMACRTGAFACTVDGDWEGAPTREELLLLDSEEPVQR